MARRGGPGTGGVTREEKKLREEEARRTWNASRQATRTAAENNKKLVCAGRLADRRKCRQKRINLNIIIIN